MFWILNYSHYILPQELEVWSLYHLQQNLCKTATLKKPQNWFSILISLNAGLRYCRMLQGEHSAILSTFIKLPFVIKIFVLYIFEWWLKTGFTLYSPKTKSSQCHYVVMTRRATKLLIAIPAPGSGLSAVNVSTATSKCSITFHLRYDQDGDV